MTGVNCLPGSPSISVAEASANWPGCRRRFWARSWSAWWRSATEGPWRTVPLRANLQYSSHPGCWTTKAGHWPEGSGMAEERVARIRAALAPQEHAVSFAVTLMEHLVVPTFVLDAEQRVLIWNHACERLTGIAAATVLGTRDHWQAFYAAPRPCLADLVCRGDYGEIDRLYTLHDDPGQPAFGVHAENWCNMPRRGERLYLAVDAGPVYDEHGKLIAVVETLRDMTERQLAQTRVREQADLLKAHYDRHLR
eukprot:RCo048444